MAYQVAGRNLQPRFKTASCLAAFAPQTSRPFPSPGADVSHCSLRFEPRFARQLDVDRGPSGYGEEVST